MRKNNTKSGYLLLDKPEGITSFEALTFIKRKLGTSKVGHTGTLDSFASGLLVVLVGRMTKLASIIESQSKSYQALAQIGIETDSLDPTGEKIKEKEPVGLDAFKKNIASFIGKIEQMPPLYSALKIGGKRSSDLVREGKPVTLSKREVQIHSLRIDSYDPLFHQLLFSLSCSKGTYVRSLIRDWANASGSCASLLKLRRTQVGHFLVDQAVSPSQFDEKIHFCSEVDLLKKIGGVAFLNLLNEHKLLNKIQYGQKIESSEIPSIKDDGLIALVLDEKLLALLEKKEGRILYRFNGVG